MPRNREVTRNREVSWCLIKNDEFVDKFQSFHWDFKMNSITNSEEKMSSIRKFSNFCGKKHVIKRYFNPLQSESNLLNCRRLLILVGTAELVIHSP